MLPAVSHSTEQLDTVHVTGAVNELFSAATLTGHNQHLSKEHWQHGFVQLPDLLSQQSGIDLHSVGGIGHYSVPVMRGSSGQQVLVFWDGLLINSLNGGATDLSRLNLEQAQSIDIYRGEAPIELSSSAVGGAINIRSYELSDNNEGAVSLIAGSYGTQKVSASQTAQFASSKWYFSADHQSADNDFTYQNESPIDTPQSPAFERRQNNRTEQTAWLAKGQIQSSFGRWDTAIQGYNGKRSLADISNDKNNRANIKSDSANIQINFRGAEHSAYPYEVKTAYRWQTEDYDDRKSQIGLGAQLNRYNTTGLSLQGNQYVIHDAWSLALTARHQQEKVDTQYRLLNQEELKQQCLAGRGCESAYTRAQTDLSSRFEISTRIGELKLQYSQINVSDKNHKGESSRNNYTKSTFSSGLTYNFDSGTSVYGKISHQLRIPTTQEIFGDRGSSIGNPNLLPETSQQVESGIVIPFHSFEISTSVYRRELKQAIFSESDSRGIIRYDNLGETLHTGLEQDISWQVSANLTLNTAFTLQSNEIIEDKRFSSYKGKQVANYDQWIVFSSAIWQKNNWFFSISNRRSGNGYYNNSNSIEKDPMNRWDARVSYQPQNWQLSLSITDATSNRARDFERYPEPGRMIFFKTKYQW